MEGRLNSTKRCCFFILLKVDEVLNHLVHLVNLICLFSLHDEVCHQCESGVFTQEQFFLGEFYGLLAPVLIDFTLDVGPGKLDEHQIIMDAVFFSQQRQQLDRLSKWCICIPKFSLMLLQALYLGIFAGIKLVLHLNLPVVKAPLKEADLCILEF